MTTILTRPSRRWTGSYSLEGQLLLLTLEPSTLSILFCAAWISRLLTH